MTRPDALLSFVVNDHDTAIALGSGDVPVLATPRVIAWLEAATVATIPGLGDDETTVGTRVAIEHLVASPVGSLVEVEASLAHRDGRLLRFSVAAHHDIGEGPVLIARGEITRVVVRRDAFVARAIPPLVIRRALPDEFGVVAQLRVTAYAEGYGLSDEPDSYRAVLEDVAAHAAAGEVLVAVRGGDLVGTVTVLDGASALSEVASPGEVEFRFMAVAPPAWRQGVARALMDAVAARAAGRPLACCVITGNEAAMELYRSLGFTSDADRDRRISPDLTLHAFVRA